MENIKSVCIIGLGLLGASIGKGLKKNGFKGQIFGLDFNQESVQYCIQEKIIDHGEHEQSKLTEYAYDLIILATPVIHIKNWISFLYESNFFESNVTVTDVGSTKYEICHQAWQYPSGYNFIGSHPMAGKERSGAQHAIASLYENATIFVCHNYEEPQSKTHFEKVINLWKFLGGVISIVEPDYHDEIVAYTSHLPHLLSMALMSFLGKHRRMHEPLFYEQKKWFGGGLVDFTRIAASSPTMWLDIFRQNKTEIQKSLDGYLKELETFKYFLANTNDEDFYKYLQNSSQLRDRMVPPKDFKDK